MSGAGSRTSQRRLTARERERRGLALRLEGKTYQQIARELGMSEAGAYKAVLRALTRLNEKIAEQADEVRRLELERLDRLLLGLWPQAARGNQGAVDRVLRIMERRARLLGLDAPNALDLRATSPVTFRVVYEDGDKDEAGE